MKYARTGKYMILSTAHLRPDTRNELIQFYSPYGSIPVLVSPDEVYGARISLPSTEEALYELPEDLRACMLYAARHLCDTIEFDPGELAVDDLPTY